MQMYPFNARVRRRPAKQGSTHPSCRLAVILPLFVCQQTPGGKDKSTGVMANVNPERCGSHPMGLPDISDHGRFVLSGACGM